MTAVQFKKAIYNNSGGKLLLWQRASSQWSTLNKYHEIRYNHVTQQECINDYEILPNYTVHTQQSEAMSLYTMNLQKD